MNRKNGIRLSLTLGLVTMVFVDRLHAQANANVVISQIYSHGGLTGAKWKYDYVEIYNRSSATVDLTNWSFQNANPYGTTWLLTPLSGSLQSGQYFLIRLGSSNPDNGDPLPVSFDLMFNRNLVSTSGKVALTRSKITLSGTYPTGTGTDIEDFVGYGYGIGGDSKEGSDFALSPTLTDSIYRKDSGLQDTGENYDDFEVLAAIPRNTSSPFHPVPEPATVGIFAMVAGLVFRKRLVKPFSRNQPEFAI